MIGDALRLEVERYAARARRTNALYVRAQEGTLGPKHLTAYLTGIHWLVLHTPLHLNVAVARANELGDAALARHYVHKLEEEQGHHAWAENDLERMALAAPRSIGVHPSMKELVAYIEGLIQDDPTLYLAYILFAEYLTVILGGEWLSILEARCGIPRASMSVIDNHATLDREHVGEGLAVIDSLVADPKKLPRMREALLGSARRFDAFCRGALEDSDAPERLEVARAPAA